MFQLMEVDGCFSKPAGEKQTGLFNNKTKFRSSHTAVGTLQHSEEHLAPWTPTRDFCWIIHSEVSNTETVAYLQHHFASPHLVALYMNQWAFCSMVQHQRKIHMDMHMHTHKHTQSNMIPEIPSVFSIGFLRERKKTFGGRLCLSKYSRQMEQRWAFHARILQRRRSTSNCERGFFIHLPHSRQFDVLATVGFMVPGRDVTAA